MKNETPIRINIIPNKKFTFYDSFEYKKIEILCSFPAGGVKPLAFRPTLKDCVRSTMLGTTEYIFI